MFTKHTSKYSQHFTDEEMTALSQGPTKNMYMHIMHITTTCFGINIYHILTILFAVYCIILCTYVCIHNTQCFRVVHSI